MEDIGKVLNDFWHVFAFILGIITKQVDTHYDVKVLKKETAHLYEKMKDHEGDLEQVKHDLNVSIKEQGKETADSLRKLTEVTSELVATTKVMASELGFMKRN